MSKHVNVNGVFRRLARAFSSKDERAFDDAMEELEEKLEKGKDGEGEDPDVVEVHNHIPDSMMRDTSMGELPPKDPPGFDRRHDDRGRDEEPPPWFKKHAEETDAKFKKMHDAVNGALEKWAKQEEKEPEHSEDRHRDEEDPNLEMDRHRDRRHDDNEPPEFGEDRRHDDRHPDDRRHDDRRSDDRHRDEANKEILGELEFEAPPGTGDRARKARDSAFMADSFQDVLSKAEVLAPGIRVPAFDAKASPVRTLRALDKLRRTALDLAYHAPATRGIIDQAMSGRTLDSSRMSISATRVLFNAAASAAEAGNNRRATDRSMEAGGGFTTARGGATIQSVADINKANRDRYVRRG